MKLQVKRLTKTAKLPEKAHRNDAGFDIFSDEEVLIFPGETVKISTGIAFQWNGPNSLSHANEVGVACVEDRSSLGSKGIHRLAGIIDIMYTGEVFVCLTNLNISKMLCMLTREEYYGAEDIWYESMYKIKRGDKIAQILFHSAYHLDVEEVEELNKTERGQAGFGSSGV